MQSFRRGRKVTGLIILVAITCVVAACSSSPALKENIVKEAPSYAQLPAEDGLLAELSNKITTSHGDEYSGFRILDTSFSGLNWRLALIDSATTSLDVQTYLWYPDFTGSLLLERAILAAQRGVKVRLIVDDLILQGHDHLIANLQAQPNIEFRMFNPWHDRGSVVERAGEMVAEMERLNTRMHDKLMIVDGRAVIIGGRNIGDHYFGLSSAFNFHDTDLFGIGHIALQCNDMFDSFWNSEWVVSADNMTTIADQDQAAEQWENMQRKVATSPELQNLPRQVKDWTEDLSQYAAELRIGRSKLIYDETHNDQIDQSVISSMFNFFGIAKKELLIMNAYVIPNQDSIDFLEGLSDRGVDVRILTNSLSSHDVPAVNSHYEPWRDDLIKAGVDLYELRSDPAIQSEVVEISPNHGEYVGLHSKSAVIDRRYLFVGSMNLDPRSANINTEMGAFIDSPALAEDLAKIIERDMSRKNAWHVQMDENGDIYWQNDKETLTSQPARNGMQRVMNYLMKLGPRDQF